jgi:FkbM family methyltransferase
VKARKLGYYARSLLALTRLLQEPQHIVPVALGRSRQLRLRDGLALFVQNRLDLLVVKETLSDDVYRLAELHEPRLIVDVGAGIGEFALAAAHRFPGCRVLAFEPGKDRFEILAQNAAASGVVVESHCVAIGTRRSYVLSGSGARSSTAGPEHAAGRSVPGRALADFLGTDEVDLLKIDCEGGELDVLQSLTPDGLGRIARVALEYHNFAGRRNDDLVTSHLVEAGFQVSIRPDGYDPARGYVYARRD